MDPATTDSEQPRNKSNRWVPPWVTSTVFALTVVALIILCIFWLPGVIVSRDVDFSSMTAAETAKARNDVRTTLIQGLGGAFFLATALFTWRQLRISQQQLELNRRSQIDQTETSRQQLEMSQVEVATGLFSEAVNQLASPSADVRTGAIYSLGRVVAQAAVEPDDVEDILSSYIRRMRAADNADDDQVALDVQAALIVLARLRRPLPDVDLSGIEGNWVPSHINLTRVSLPNLYLPGTNLQRWRLQGANLTNMNFFGADLGRANLNGARIDRGQINAAQCTHVYAIGAQATNLRASEANLGRALLSGADLRDADLRYADLVHAYLGELPLQHWFIKLDLIEQEFRDDPSNETTEIRYFSEEAKNWVSLWAREHANFLGPLSYTTGDTVPGADLRNADLRGAILRGAYLDGAQFAGAKADAETVWPIGFDPLQAGVVMVEAVDTSEDALGRPSPE